MFTPTLELRVLKCKKPGVVERLWLWSVTFTACEGYGLRNVCVQGIATSCAEAEKELKQAEDVTAKRLHSLGFDVH